MNREIKFRGQMTTGEWVYGLPHLDLPGSTIYFNECSYRICWSPETGGSANAPIKNGTLGQFTGLKDKNGKEIYEGDIVTEGYHEKYGRYEVKWEKCGFNLITGGDEGSWEVLGNIYENKEQLTPSSTGSINE